MHFIFFDKFLGLVCRRVRLLAVEHGGLQQTIARLYTYHPVSILQIELRESDHR